MTVMGAGQDSVEIMVAHDVLVMVTVSTVLSKGNAVTAVKIEATVNPE